MMVLGMFPFFWVLVVATQVQTHSTPLDAMLVEAVSDRDLEGVARFLRAGADPNAVNANGRTVLMLAATFGERDIVGALLDAGADVDVQTAAGDTALTLAANWGHPEIVAMLQSGGALRPPMPDEPQPPRPQPPQEVIQARYESLSTDEIPLVQTKAQAGDAEAQFYLGLALLEGRLIPKDEDEAMRWLSLSAEQNFRDAHLVLAERQRSQRNTAQAKVWYQNAIDLGSPGAMVGLGEMYERGDGVAPDRSRAVYWFQRAADLGYPGGQYALGVAHRDGVGIPPDPAEAVKWFRLAAEQGHMDAQYDLGVMLEKGRGVPRDLPEAMRWYRAAAAQGDGAAMNNIGYKYQKGDGVPRNGGEAVRWYLRAIEHGELEYPAHNLARVYEDAIDVPRDRISAYMWRRFAHWESERLTKECVKDLVKKMSRAEIQEANRRAAQWPPWRVGLCATMFPGETARLTSAPFEFPPCGEISPSFTRGAIPALERNAAEGDPIAQCWLGLAFALGRGVDQSDAKASVWLQEAARQGNAAAQYALGNFFEYGRGVDGDMIQAMGWYRKAAEQGLAAAQAKVGFHYSGQGSLKEAVEWTRTAAEQGDLMAQINLAGMYADGRGVPRDHTRSYGWTLIARNQACHLEPDSWEKHGVDPEGLIRLLRQEEAKLPPEEKAEAERWASEYLNRRGEDEDRSPDLVLPPRE